LGSREKQQFLLDIGGQLQQVHDLGDSRPRNVAQPGQFGLISHDAIANQAVKSDCERHELGYPRNASDILVRRRFATL
jgi:hypothetical protein